MVPGLYNQISGLYQNDARARYHTIPSAPIPENEAAFLADSLRETAASTKRCTFRHFLRITLAVTIIHLLLELLTAIYNTQPC